MAGGDSLKRPAISPEDSAPAASISMMRWRVGSERAWSAVMINYFRIYLIKSIQKY